MHCFVRWRAPAVATAAALAVALPGTAAAQAARTASSPQQPRLKLIVAQRTVTNFSYQGQVQLDPAIWFASLGANFRLNVSAATYGKPNSLTELLRNGSKVTIRRLPTSLLDGFNGLKGFFRVTLHNAKGKAAFSELIDYCPGNFDPERVSGNGPINSPYPEQCSASGGLFLGADPFSKGEVWGLASGWAIDPTELTGFGSGGTALPIGTYTATVNVTTGYSKLFGIGSSERSASDTVVVVKGTGSAPRGASARPGTSHPAARHSARPLAQLPASVPTLAHPPASSLPDLVALPAWGISASATTKPATDLLNFGATVWMGGNAQLDVEGFRQNGSTTMPAYQYFFRNGKVIGRTRAGTMGFDSKNGHDHWHFQQFAEYRLLSSAKKVLQDSGKIGFCIAPTDSVDMLVPHAVWQPSFIGFSGQCGSPSALWVREQLPNGWGDTYQQQVAGQSFDITKVPNGTYYIEIIANPEHVLHELSTANDISLRKIIISGPPGNRHVKVPAVNGIDPEG